MREKMVDTSENWGCEEKLGNLDETLEIRRKSKGNNLDYQNLD